MKDMIISSTDSVPGIDGFEYLGLVSGAKVRSKNALRDIGAGLKSLVGGELKGYSEMMEQARNEAIQRMKDQATNLGADAIVGFRLQTSSVMGGASEVMAYGTAVKIKE